MSPLLSSYWLSWCICQGYSHCAVWIGRPLHWSAQQTSNRSEYSCKHHHTDSDLAGSMLWLQTPLYLSIYLIYKALHQLTLSSLSSSRSSSPPVPYHHPQLVSCQPLPHASAQWVQEASAVHLHDSLPLIHHHLKTSQFKLADFL